MSDLPGNDRQRVNPILIRGSAAAAVAAIVLTIDALVRGRGDIDYRLIRAIQEIDGPFIRPLLLFVNDLTDAFWAVTLWAGLLVYLAIALRSWLPALTVGLIPLGGAANWAIRHIVDRQPPDPDRLIRTAGDVDAPSFPSGSVVGAVIFYGVIFLLARNIRYAPLRVPVQLAAASVILLSGLAEVWLGTHWLSDVATAYALGLSILLAIAWFYRKLAIEAGNLPFIHAAPVPVDESIPQAHALTSTILFQDDVVTKIYAPGFLPRAVYWLSFQAQFPYIRNRAALEAAVLRRNLAGKLTEFWYGSNRVARAHGIVKIDGRLGLASERIRTAGEQNSDAELEFLYDLCDRFDEAGLPTWQIDPRQPRGKDNVLHGEDGLYYIVDLESGLVSPLASPRAWWRAIARANFPMFDTVYFDITRDYVQRNEGAMRDRMGDSWYTDLLQLLSNAEAADRAWREGEPRIWSRILRAVESLFGIGGLIRRLRSAAAGNRERAEAMLSAMVGAWEAEQRISTDEAANIRRTLAKPQIHRVIPHFAVHLTIGIAMRFPVGSILRASYTLLNLLAATISLLVRKIDRAEWRSIFSIHSPLVIAVAGMPGIGTFAYLLSGPIRSNRLMLRMVADTMLMKIPGGIYERMGWRSLVARPAGWTSPADPAVRGVSFGKRTRQAAFVLAGLGAALIIGHVLIEFLTGALEFEDWRLADLGAALAADAPDTLTTWYGLALLTTTASVALMISLMLWVRDRRRLAEWGALALVALALVFEEHLPVDMPGTSAVEGLLSGSTGLANWLWLLAWAVAIVVAALAGYRFILALPLQLRGLIVIGVLLFAGGAAGFEVIGSAYRWLFDAGDLEYTLITAVEELAEVLGIVVVLFVLMEYARLSIAELRAGSQSM